MAILPAGYSRVLVGPKYYVSTSGSDTVGTGTQANPWATIGHAQTAIRAAGVLSGMTADVTLYIGPGDYWLGETGGGGKITLTDADSGSGAFNFIIAAQNGRGTVRLLGGKRVTGWSLYSGSIYRAAVSGSFNTMYEGGVRGVQARTPAFVPDASFPCARAPYLNTTGVDTSQTVVQYGVGDLTTPNLWDLTSARIFIWSGGLGGGVPGGSRAWLTDDIPIQSVNTGSRQLTLSTSTIYSVFATAVGGRYFAQGDLSMLTGAGQWYHDAAGGFLYYWPRNTPIASQEIVIPTMTNVVEMIGASTGSRIRNVVLQDLEIEYSDYLATWQVVDEVHQNHGVVYVTNADHVGVSGCNIHAAGIAGIYMQSYVQDSTISTTWIHNTGADGIISENFPGISADIGDVNTRNIIRNVRINNVGELVGSGTAIYLLNVSNHDLKYLDLHDGPRIGVSIIGAFNSFGAAKTYAKGNLVQYAKLRNFAQDSGDVGAVYYGQNGDAGTPGVNTINQITIDNTKACASMTDFLPDGVFMDNNSNGQVMNNVSVTNSGDTDWRTNGSGSGTTSNVSWVGGFNSALIDTWNIGVRGDFPY